jgi:hypothetical protein
VVASGRLFDLCRCFLITTFLQISSQRQFATFRGFICQQKTSCILHQTTQCHNVKKRGGKHFGYLSVRRRSHVPLGTNIMDPYPEQGPIITSRSDVELFSFANELRTEARGVGMAWNDIYLGQHFRFYICREAIASLSTCYGDCAPQSNRVCRDTKVA